MKKFKDRIKEKIALLRLMQGDTEAFGFLYDEYVQRIYRYIFFRVSDKDVAQDLTQEVFLQTWEYISSKRGVSHLQSFLYRVAYNKVVDHYRFKERQATLMSTLGEELGPIDDGLLANAAEMDMHFLSHHIQKLKQEYQDMIAFRYIEGLSIGEISEITEKEHNNVRVTIHRAMAALRSLVKQEPKNKK